MTCQHDMCTCSIDEGLDYCAPTCRTGIAADGGCSCGHADCDATEGEATL